MQLVRSTPLFFLLLLVAVAAFAQNEQPALHETMQSLDTQLFEAANHCDYEKLTALVDENLEFYHDLGGLALGRQTFLDAVKTNTCGVMIRELVPGTLEVYPIKGYGAMEVGVHRFHHPGHEKEFPAAKQLGMTRFLDPGAAEWPVGEAKFLQIWQLKDGSWKLTRVVSYGHQSSTAK
jgi:Domain of unknown function (DUF4440)